MLIHESSAPEESAVIDGEGTDGVEDGRFAERGAGCASWATTGSCIGDSDGVAGSAAMD